MHPAEGKLMAYLEGQLDAGRTGRLTRHLEGCARCREQLIRLDRQRQWLAGRLAMLEPGPEVKFPSLEETAGRFHERIHLTSTQEEIPMFWQRQWKSHRVSWLSAAAVVVVVLALTFQPVRTLAFSFLELFRMNKVAVVEYDSHRMADTIGRRSLQERFGVLFQEHFKMEQEPRQEVVAGLEDLSRRCGYPVRLPALPAGWETRLLHQSQACSVITLDRQLLQAIRDELEIMDLDLPDGAGQVSLRLMVPDAAFILLGPPPLPALGGGAGGREQRPDRRAFSQVCTLIQLPGPSVTSSYPVDIQRLGGIYLQMLGFTPEEVTSLNSQIDWATTMVMPIPYGFGQIKQVPVDGVTGILLAPSAESPFKTPRFLLWVREGRVYGLSGFNGEEELLELANSME